jgi:hypothetical protein
LTLLLRHVVGWGGGVNVGCVGGGWLWYLVSVLSVAMVIDELEGGHCARTSIELQTFGCNFFCGFSFYPR